MNQYEKNIPSLLKIKAVYSNLVNFSKFLCSQLFKSRSVATVLERTSRNGEFCSYFKNKKKIQLFIPQIKIYAFVSGQPMTELLKNYKQ